MSGSKCKRCVNDKIFCERCIDNPVYQELLSKLKSFYMEYEPACPYGYEDCVSDPAYIKYYYPDWYKELYGEISPKEAISKKNCWDEDDMQFCKWYDNEDK